MKKSKVVALTLIVGIASSSLLGCGGTATPASSSAAAVSSTSSSAATSSQDGSDVKTVQIATSGSPKPFNFVGTDKKPTGYEIELLQKVDEQLKDYKFEYNVTEFDSLFAGLDSKKYDLIAGNLSRTAARDAKYVISKQSYCNPPTVLITNQDNTAVKSIDDVGGLNIPAGAGRAQAIFLESYNKQHPQKPVKITYTDAGSDALLVDLHNKRYDACLYNETAVDFVLKTYGYKFNIIKLTDAQSAKIYSEPGVWLFYNQDDKKLRDEVDTVLQKFTKDGTLSALAQKWFGKPDYIENLPVSTVKDPG